MRKQYKKQAAIDKSVCLVLARLPNITVRELARLVGCSVGAAANAPAWKQEMVRRHNPGVESLDQQHIDSVADPRAVDPKQAAIARLIEEQRQDQMTDEGRRRHRKRL
jgi:hypothetical protein